ncbi:MAG: thioesterase family protein [Candidatus Methylomirabilales bacterium]
MGQTLQPGMTFTQTITVTHGLTAAHLAAEGLAVFSTPELVRFIERCALLGVRPFLAEGQDTVGTHVDVRHLAPTPVGMQVTARATLVEVDRRRLRFTVEVHDELDKVGEGSHERFIVDRDRQQRRVEEKVARWKPPA